MAVVDFVIIHSFEGTNWEGFELETYPNPATPDMTAFVANQSNPANNGLWAGTTTDPENPTPMQRTGTVSEDDLVIAGNLISDVVMDTVPGPYILAFTDPFDGPAAWRIVAQPPVVNPPAEGSMYEYIRVECSVPENSTEGVLNPVVLPDRANGFRVTVMRAGAQEYGLLSINDTATNYVAGLDQMDQIMSFMSDSGRWFVV